MRCPIACIQACALISLLHTPPPACLSEAGDKGLPLRVILLLLLACDGDQAAGGRLWHSVVAMDAMHGSRLLGLAEEVGG